MEKQPPFIYPTLEEMQVKLREKIGEGWCGLRYINGISVSIRCTREQLDQFLENKTQSNYEQFVKDMYLLVFTDKELKI
jgi:hypothetical protein